MNKYKVKAVKNVYYEIEVEANSKEEAIEKAMFSESDIKEESEKYIIKNATFKIKNI